MRLVWVAFGIVVSVLAAAEGFGQEPTREDRRAHTVLSHVDGLARMALDKEPEAPRIADDRVWGELEGAVVAVVTAFDPPAGLDPVKDAKITIGAPLTPALVRGAVIRLWESGRYRDVTIRAAQSGPGKVDLVIEVAPMLRVQRLEISGNRALDDDAIARVLDFEPGRTIEPDPETLRRARGELLNAFAQRGYREAHASLRLETTDEPGEVVLFVEVEEGRPELYTRIQAPGWPERVSRTLVLRGLGLKSGMVRDRERAEKAASQIAAKLAKFGFYDAKIESLREIRTGPYSFDLEVPVDPGVRSSLRFVGNRHLRFHRLKKEILGDGAFDTSEATLARSARDLVALYRNQGFFHAQVAVHTECVGSEGEIISLLPGQECPRDADLRIVRFAVEEGPTVVVRDVRFFGNEHFSDEELEAELRAFMTERLADESLLRPLDTQTADEIGLSDRRPKELGGHAGTGAPWGEPGSTYVPELYTEAMAHLMEMHAEQGFLSAKVTDACDVGELAPLELRGTSFRPFLVDRGSLDFKAEEPGVRPCVRISERLDELVVDVFVREGPQTELSEILFEGNTVLSSRALQGAAGVALKDPYNEFRLREAARKIRDVYMDEGYMFAQVHWDKVFSADMRSAKLVFHVEEGPRARVGSVLIEGATTTSHSILMDRMSLEPGDVITPDELDESGQRLMDLGVLDAATVQMVQPDFPAEVKNLKVRVTEGKTQYLELRAGIATVEGVRGGFEYGYRNIGGWALSARLRARANYRLFFIGTPDFERRYRELGSLGDQLEHHLMAGLAQPFLPGTGGLLGWGVDAIKEQLNEPAFSADRITTFLRLNSTLGFEEFRRAFVVELRAGLELSNITVAQEVNDPRFARYSRIPEDESVFWVTGIKVTSDFRDHPFYPSRGFLAVLTGDWIRSLEPFALKKDAATGEVQFSTSNLMRTGATLSGYLPVVGRDLVLALSTTVGYIFHLEPNSTTWADRFFYVGGVDTLRGFPEESLVPEDIYQSWKDSLPYADEAANLRQYRGGESMFVVRAELRYPLAQGFYGAAFGEAGNLWRAREQIANIVTWDPLSVHLRPVAGVGLRYLTPLGPVSFDLGGNLDRRPHEDPLYWYLSIGTAF